jgi:transposase
LCYPAAYLKVVGKTLMLPTGGGSGHGPKKYPNIVATLTEEPPTDFREVAISRDARGSYYASFSYRQEEHSQEPGEVVAFDLGMKTLAVGVNEQGHLYHIGDLSQKQMVIKEHQDRKQERHTPLNRAVFNDWGLSPFMQMLLYKCILAGKEVVKLDERDTSKLCSGCRNLQPMPLHKRTYRCPNCGLVMDRDENSAHNLLARFFARLGPHTDRRSVRCADVFTAIENVDTCEHIEKGRHMCKNTC